MTKRVIVIHTAECGETDTAAEGVARYLQGRHLPVHYTVDSNSHVQMIPLTADCRAARGLPAADGIHIEHAGRASQTPAEWADTYSDIMLGRSALLAARACIQFGIPARHITGVAVKNGRGIVGHHDVSVAYNVVGGHWDPGPAFPWDHYINMVAINMLALSPPAPAPAPAPAPVQPTPPPPTTGLAEVFRALQVLIFTMRVAASRGKVWTIGSPTVPEVKMIQAAMVKVGQNVAVDGDYGPATAANVKWYQAVRHLTADGVVGDQTLALMYPG